MRYGITAVPSEQKGRSWGRWAGPSDVQTRYRGAGTGVPGVPSRTRSVQREIDWPRARLVMGRCNPRAACGLAQGGAAAVCPFGAAPERAVEVWAGGPNQKAGVVDIEGLSSWRGVHNVTLQWA